jgi:hypothetical protein
MTTELSTNPALPTDSGPSGAGNPAKQDVTGYPSAPNAGGVAGRSIRVIRGFESTIAA